MASLGSSLKAMVSLVRVLTKICVCVPCRRRLFGSPEDVVVLETHVLCAYPVSLLSDLYSPFPFLLPVALPLPLLSLSLSLFCACACAPLRLRPFSTHSFACVDVARLVPNQLFLCRLFACVEVVGVEDVVVFPFPCSFLPPLFPLPYISSPFLSFPVPAIVLACHML